MKLTVCGSMKFASQMQEAKKTLEDLGYDVVIPDLAEDYIEHPDFNESQKSAERKIAHDFIRKHYQEIMASDAILVLNYDKNDIKNYIGANTFLEIGFAHVLHKPIFCLHPLPDQAYISSELVAMQAIILDGDLTRISNHV